MLVHLLHEFLPAVISCIITKHSPTKLLQGQFAEEKGENLSTCTDKTNLGVHTTLVVIYPNYIMHDVGY